MANSTQTSAFSSQRLESVKVRVFCVFVRKRVNNGNKNYCILIKLPLHLPMNIGLTMMWLIASAMRILLAPLFGIISINLIESLFWGVDMQSQYHSSQVRSVKSYSDAIFHCDWWWIEALCVWIVNMTILNNHTFGRKRAADCTTFDRCSQYYS